MTNGGLWEKLNNRHQQNVANRRSQGQNNLYQNIIYGSDTKTNNGLFGGDSSDWASAGKGFGNLYNAFSQGGSSSSSSPAIQSAINSEVSGFGGSSGSAITDAINGGGGSGSAVTDALNTEMGSSSGSGGGSNVPWAAIAMAAKSGYNKLSNKTDKDYSDTEEAIIYPLQGAAMGNSFSNGNPWATAGGALYGLGYSFKDDMGMKDSNFLTQMIFPIDLGDGGGLKIGGKSITDFLQ